MSAPAAEAHADAHGSHVEAHADAPKGGEAKAEVHVEGKNILDRIWGIAKKVGRAAMKVIRGVGDFFKGLGELAVKQIDRMTDGAEAIITSIPEASNKALARLRSPIAAAAMAAAAHGAPAHGHDSDHETAAKHAEHKPEVHGHGNGNAATADHLPHPPAANDNAHKHDAHKPAEHHDKGDHGDKKAA